ncbi:hypothetical protein BGZ94_002208 [Podila epigama]|nr:hypothetical protein BGZ94_002208 [Podila epigama]
MSSSTCTTTVSVWEDRTVLHNNDNDANKNDTRYRVNSPQQLALQKYPWENPDQVEAWAKVEYHNMDVPFILNRELDTHGDPV